MNNNLLILGFGRIGFEAMEIAKEMNCFSRIDFPHDENDSAVGKIAEYEKLSVDYSYAYPAFENPNEHLNWIQKSEESCYKIPKLVHPQAFISLLAQQRKGTIVELMAAVKGNSSVGIGCIISSGVVVKSSSFVSDLKTDFDEG